MRSAAARPSLFIRTDGRTLCAHCATPHAGSSTRSRFGRVYASIVCTRHNVRYNMQCCEPRGHFAAYSAHHFSMREGLLRFRFERRSSAIMMLSLHGTEVHERLKRTGAVRLLQRALASSNELLCCNAAFALESLDDGARALVHGG